jgi:dipeptidyl aminopeptidase/acylaminoacyl peptidase
VPQFDASKPAGTIVSQNLPANATPKPGTKVQLVVSAGFPRIAFSDGKEILIMSGANGSGTKPLAPSPGNVEDEPSWQPAPGTLVAFRRGPANNPNSGAIWIANTTGKPAVRQLTNGSDDRRPAFSPDGQVIAFSRPSADGKRRELCFVRVASTEPAGACLGDTSLSVDRPTWSPDGRTILAETIDPVDVNQTELVEYTSSIPDSSRPSDWVKQSPLVTDGFHSKKPGEGVILAAFSPDGKRVAIVANWGATDLGSFQIWLSSWNEDTDTLGRPNPLHPSVSACGVAWRPDSGELVVMQANPCVAGGTGAIVRVDPGTSAEQPLAQGGRDPVWESIPLNGH